MSATYYRIDLGEEIGTAWVVVSRRRGHPTTTHAYTDTGEAVDLPSGWRTTAEPASLVPANLLSRLLGARGGRAGRGAAKRRATSFDGASGAAAGSANGKAKRRGGPEHYRELAAKSAAARAAKKDTGTP